MYIYFELKSIYSLVHFRLSVIARSYSQVANRRGGRLLIFPTPPFRTFLLLTCYIFNSFQAKTPIRHLFEAFLPNIIHLLVLSMIILLEIKVNCSTLKVDFRPPPIYQDPPFIEF